MIHLVTFIKPKCYQWEHYVRYYTNIDGDKIILNDADWGMAPTALQLYFEQRPVFAIECKSENPYMPKCYYIDRYQFNDRERKILKYRKVRGMVVR